MVVGATGPPQHSTRLYLLLRARPPSCCSPAMPQANRSRFMSDAVARADEASVAPNTRVLPIDHLNAVQEILDAEETRLPALRARLECSTEGPSHVLTHSDEPCLVAAVVPRLQFRGTSDSSWTLRVPITVYFPAPAARVNGRSIDGRQREPHGSRTGCPRPRRFRNQPTRHESALQNDRRGVGSFNTRLTAAQQKRAPEVRCRVGQGAQSPV